MTTSNTGKQAVDIEFLKREFERLRTGLAGVKESLGENASAALGEISAHLDAAHFAALEDRLESLSAKLKDTGKDAAAKLESEVTARPLASVALAFGIGLLAAQFLRKPSS